MHRWAAVGLLLLVLGGPIIWPLASSFQVTENESIWSEWQRVGTLAAHTLALLALTLLIALPVATILAGFLGSTNLVGRHFLLLLVVIGLSIPLPIVGVAWQGFSLAGWSPFRSGILAAAWIHAVAGLPWMVAILVLGLSTTDPALDDFAHINADWRSRFQFVFLPRLRTPLLIAMLWLAATISGEIVITDLMQVRTFGEEVYTQFVSPAAEAGISIEGAIARAVTLSLPLILVLATVGIWVSRRSTWQGHTALQKSKPLFELGQWRIGITCIAFIAVLAYFVIPIVALALRAGVLPQTGWTIDHFVTIAVQATRESAQSVIQSLFCAVVTGAFISAIALILCWWARSISWIRMVLYVFAAAIIVTPAPVVGVGLRMVINWMLDVESRFGLRVADRWLYNGPSYLPVMWVWAIRGFPLAVAILWPVVRNWPTSPAETIHLETSRSRAIGRHILWPRGRQAFFVATGLTALYCFGEVSASQIAATPGGLTFAHSIFARMHFGLTPDLAAQCLCGLLVVFAAGLIWIFVVKLRSTAD